MQGNNQQNQQKGASLSKPALSWSAPGGAGAQQAVKPPLLPPKGAVTAVMPQSYGRNALISAFVGGLLVGVLFGWMWFGGTDVQPAVSGTVEEQENKNVATSGNRNSDDVLSASNALDILVETQVAGLTVEVSNVAVGKPTWVVVYESRNGALGNVLGARLFFPTSQGGSTDGSVTLLRATSAGQTYFVGQYIDNGDRKFSIQNDTRVLGQNGEPLLASFKTR